MKRVHIAAMAYEGALPTHTMTMIMTANVAMLRRGWDVVFKQRQGDSLVQRARNAAAAEFLHDPNATDLIMVDADTFCEGAGLVRLVEHEGVDIVGAPYRARCEPLSWSSVRFLHETIGPAENGLLEVDGTGTGLTRYSRTCIEEMVAHCPYPYRDPTTAGGKAWPLFWVTVVPPNEGQEFGELWGEDLTFCREWRKLGGRVYVDPSITTVHIGKTFYQAKLEDWLINCPKFMDIEDVTGKKSRQDNLYSHQLKIVEEAAKIEVAA